MQNLQVEDVMTREVLAVAADTSLETAARLLASRHISGAPVIDDQGRAVGVITQSDLCDPDRDVTGKLGRSLFYRVGERATAALGGERVHTVGVVADVMSPFVLSVSPQTPIAEAARLMVHDEVHRLLVVKGGKLVGIVSAMDVLRALAREVA
jgi:CBS domain-containing protein